MMHGAHIASIGGSWMALVYGFGGMRDYRGQISFRPCLPERWQRLRFRLTIRGSAITVEVRPYETTYTLRAGGDLSIEHEGEALRLSPGTPSVTLPNRCAGPQV